MREWHDPQKAIPLLLKQRAVAREGLDLAKAGKKKAARAKLREAEQLGKRARQPLGRLG